MASSWRWRLWALPTIVLLVVFFRSSPNSPLQPIPTPNLGHSHGLNFIFQLPSGGMQGVLFLAHGCGCKATFFWDHDPRNCPGCIGLPEERVYVREALARKLAVIAISSSGNCWSRRDEQPVVSILTSWMLEQGLVKLPVFALGASSGGYFVSRLATSFSFTAVVIMIAEGVFTESGNYATFPRTLFVHMPRDKPRAIGVAKSIEILGRNGVEASEIRCKPLKIGPGFFAERIEGMDLQRSRGVYHALLESGLVSEGGFVVGDGRSVDWKSPVLAAGVLEVEEQSRIKWEKHIQEELNVAFAFHELTSLPCKLVFDWLLKGLKP